MAAHASIFLQGIGVMEVVRFDFSAGDQKGPTAARFVKAWDEKSPALTKALANGQVFGQAVVTFRRHKPDGGRGLEISDRVRLVQARITAIKRTTADGITHQPAAPPPELETVEMTCLQVVRDRGDAPPPPAGPDSW